MNSFARFLAGALSVAIASACFAAQSYPENPGLTDARILAQPPEGERLSLFALENRLRETQAISPLRKFGLRVEIDALMVRLRRAHSRGGAEVAALQRPYERLMGKMQVMAKDDQKFAADITVSREPIWRVLADRAQFASIQ
jgi:hypothetical protein